MWLRHRALRVEEGRLHILASWQDPLKVLDVHHLLSCLLKDVLLDPVVLPRLRTEHVGALNRVYRPLSWKVEAT